MKKRLRKKLHLKEFKKRGRCFEVFFSATNMPPRGPFPSEKEEQEAWYREHDSLSVSMREWGLMHYCWTYVGDGCIYVESRKPKGKRFFHYVTEEDRQSFIKMIAQNPLVDDYYVGPLFDYPNREDNIPHLLVDSPIDTLYFYLRINK